MSLNQILDDGGTIQNYMDLKCDNLRCNKINGRSPIAIIPGLNNQILQTNAGAVSWDYMSLQNFNPILGPAKSILSVNALGTAAEFSRVIDCDSINIVNDITLNSVAAGADKVLGTDGLGVPTWLSYSTAQNQIAMYNMTAQNFNAAASVDANFNPVAVYDNIGLIWDGINFEFELPPDQTFELQAVINVSASASECDFELKFDGNVVSDSNISPSESSAICSSIITTTALANKVQVTINRVGADASAKNNYSLVSSWLKVVRIA